MRTHEDTCGHMVLETLKTLEKQGFQQGGSESIPMVARWVPVGNNDFLEGTCKNHWEINDFHARTRDSQRGHMDRGQIRTDEDR